MPAIAEVLPGYDSRGTGGMTHNDPDSRPAAVFGGRESYLLLPIIPAAWFNRSPWLASLRASAALN